MEHLFAYPTCTLISGHRGDLFNKVIHITTNKPLSFAVRIPPNSNCEITIGDRNVQAQAPFLRNFTIMLLNAAILNPDFPDEPPFSVKDYLEQVLPTQMPDVLIISSTGNGFNPAYIPATVESLNRTLVYATSVGADGGAFSVSFNGDGNFGLNEAYGNNIETGIVLEYDWF